MNLALPCVVETYVFLAFSSEPSPAVPLGSSPLLPLLPASLQGVGTTVSSEKILIGISLLEILRDGCI